MNCRRASRMIQAYLDGDLPVQKAQVLEGHFGNCPKCKEELLAYQALIRTMEVAPPLEVPFDFVPLISSQLPAIHPAAEHLRSCRLARFAASVTRWISPRLSERASAAGAWGCRTGGRLMSKVGDAVSGLAGVFRQVLHRLCSLLESLKPPR